MRRGLTLVELLMSVGLLASLTVSLSAWLAVTTRTYAAHAESTQWRAAADSTLRLIREDLSIGDFGRDEREQAVDVKNEVLAIRTRAHGPGAPRGSVLHEYRFDPAKGEVRLIERGPSSHRAEHVLLNDVADWQCILDGDSELITMSIRSQEGIEVSEVFRIR